MLIRLVYDGGAEVEIDGHESKAAEGEFRHCGAHQSALGGEAEADEEESDRAHLAHHHHVVLAPLEGHAAKVETDDHGHCGQLLQNRRGLGGSQWGEESEGGIG